MSRRWKQDSNLNTKGTIATPQLNVCEHTLVLPEELDSFQKNKHSKYNFRPLQE